MKKIKEIINVWDPYSLFPYAPEDEYAIEIAHLEKFIKEHLDSSDSDLAQYMKEVFELEDIEKDKRNFLQIATKIFDTVQSINS